MWRNCVLLFCIFQLSSAATLRCYNNFLDYVDIPLDTPEDLIASPCLDVNKPSDFVAIGFNFKLEGPLLSALIPSLLNSGDSNVLLVNWQKEAGDAGLGVIGYLTNALPQTKIIGNKLGEALATLVKLGLNKTIHLIGHSLGANLLGYAGRKATDKGFTVPMITALDPARLGFDPGYKLVDPSSAAFVSAVHSDMGGYAVNRSVGHVDIWLNRGLYINGPKLQPGCQPSFTLQDIAVGGNLCSHDRSWQAFNVSLSQPELFVAGRAANYSDFVDHKGQFDVVNYIGPLINPKNLGDFYLVTGATQPWGLGTDGLSP